MKNRLLLSFTLLLATLVAVGTYADLGSSAGSGLGANSNQDIPNNRDRTYSFSALANGTDFTAYPSKGKAPLSVAFDAVSDVSAQAYAWNFGDGEVDSTRNPIHDYTLSGIYTVELHVIVDSTVIGGTDTVIKVGAIIVDDLDAEFKADVIAGVPPLTVQFTDLSTGSPDIWVWDFGDGNISLVQNPIHHYDAIGQYDVTLQVGRSNFKSGVAGAAIEDEEIKLEYIRVGAELKADLEISALVGFSNVVGWGQPQACQEYGYWLFWANSGTAIAENCTLKVRLPMKESGISGYPYDVNFIEIDTLDIAGGGGSIGAIQVRHDTVVIPLGGISAGHAWPAGGGRLHMRVDVGCGLFEGYLILAEAWLSTSTIEIDTLDNNYRKLVEPIVTSSTTNRKVASPPNDLGIKGIDIGQPITFSLQTSRSAKAVGDTVSLRILDTLDANLDWPTYVFNDISNPDQCVVTYDALTGIIFISCDNLFLPPDLNPPFFITYTVTPDEGLPDPTQIYNTAWIRIDSSQWEEANESGPVVRTVSSSCCTGITGNIDGDAQERIDITDLTFLVGYMFGGGPTPPCIDEARVSGVSSKQIDIHDLTYLINYMFSGGPAPVLCP